MNIPILYSYIFIIFKLNVFFTKKIYNLKKHSWELKRKIVIYIKLINQI